jgi:hypothetical protein
MGFNLASKGLSKIIEKNCLCEINLVTLIFRYDGFWNYLAAFTSFHCFEGIYTILNTYNAHEISVYHSSVSKDSNHLGCDAVIK